ncbi:FeoB small GTPase domain-containing protein, partial [Planctomycetota bacterium]
MHHLPVLQKDTRPSLAADKESELAQTAGDHKKSNDGSENTVLLLGNLNVGKTTLFNRICGRHLKAANYPGTSVSIGRGDLSEGGAKFHLIDTPGINSMMPESEDEKISWNILLDEKPDTIALIADGKNMRKSLLLTLQLAEFGIPLILNINMMDEVRQRGIHIDTEKLSLLINAPVTETIATEGEGVRSFRKLLPKAKSPRMTVSYPEKLESAINLIAKLTDYRNLSPRAVATALLAGDEDMKDYLAASCGVDVVRQIESITLSVQSTF